MVAVPRATAIAGSGLEGDRYTTKRGHWSPIARSGDGLTLIDSPELSDDAAATVAEIKETRTGQGTTLTVKRYDKGKALELLSRHLGLLEVPANDNADGPPFDLRQLLRLALERAAGARRSAPAIEAAALEIGPRAQDGEP